MENDKQPTTSIKNQFLSLINHFLRILIFFLAKTGDGIIIISRGIFFIFIKAFSIFLGLSRRLYSFLIKHFLLLLLSATSFFIKNFPKFSSRRYSAIKRELAHKILLFITRTRFMWASQANRLKHLPTVTRKITEIRIPPVAFPQIHLPQFPRPRHLLPHFPPAFWGFVLGALVVFFFVFIPFNIYSYLRLLPHPRLLSQRIIPVTTQIFDRNGNLLYEIHGNEDRKPVPLADIPVLVKNATIAIEDKTFYQHPGFSLTAIARAARETFINQRRQGGSTITQQLVKNALLTREISYERKLREILLAFWAERLYSKDEILEMYLNQVPYGGTAYGIEAAAQTYFGKGVSDLTLGEAAYLAGLPAAPTYYSPYGSRPDLARVRQKEVLERMTEEHFITKAEAEDAVRQSLSIQPHATNIEAPHFVMYIRELLSGKYGPRMVDQGGLKVVTTLDLPLQRKVQEIVSKNIEDLKWLKVGNGAAVVTNPQTGEIMAMVGSRNYFDESGDGNVNVVLSPRQPGSSIKPVNYTAALENGITAATIIDDAPVAYTLAGQPTYVPINYDGRFHGKVTVRQALANSYNIPAVKILNRIGVKTMIDMGKRMGITTWEEETRFGLALTLGGGEVTLFDMSTVYSVLANGGSYIEPEPFLRISDYTGRVYYEKGAPKRKQVVAPEIAFILSDILSDNQARSAAFGANSALQIVGKTVAVKTGTTNDKRDNWTIGYTPSYVVGVWVGNNDNTPMDPYLTSGITGAAPIWNQIMQELLVNKNDEIFPLPANIVALSCFGRTEYFIRGTEPKGGCGSFPSPNPTSSP